MRYLSRPLVLLPVLALAAACSSSASATPPKEATPAESVAGRPTPSLATGAAASQTAGAPSAQAGGTAQPSAPATADPGSAAPWSGTPVQTSNVANVTMSVTWNGPDAGAVFAVEMDNHMLDLGSVDLSKATLTNDRGERMSGPTWAGGASGHHRSGALTFGAFSSTFFTTGGWIKLALPAVGDDSPRAFQWNLSH